MGLHKRFGLTAQQVLSETPKSQLFKKPTSNERRTERRRKSEMTYRNVWMNTAVIQNRISWSVFDKIRKTEGLGVPPKRKQLDDSENHHPLNACAMVARLPQICQALSVRVMFFYHQLTHSSHKMSRIFLIAW